MIIDLKEVKTGEPIVLMVNGVQLFVGIAYDVEELKASTTPLREVFGNRPVAKTLIEEGGFVTAGDFWTFFFDNGSDIHAFRRKLHYMGPTRMNAIEEYVHSVIGDVGLQP